MEVFVVTNRGSSFLLIQVQLVQLIRLTIHNCSNESIVFKTVPWFRLMLHALIMNFPQKHVRCVMLV